jgi:hypothetical protein
MSTIKRLLIFLYGHGLIGERTVQRVFAWFPTMKGA